MSEEPATYEARPQQEERCAECGRSFNRHRLSRDGADAHPYVPPLPVEPASTVETAALRLAEDAAEEAISAFARVEFTLTSIKGWLRHNGHTEQIEWIERALGKPVDPTPVEPPQECGHCGTPADCTFIYPDGNRCKHPVAHHGYHVSHAYAPPRRAAVPESPAPEVCKRCDGTGEAWEYWGRAKITCPDCSPAPIEDEAMGARDELRRAAGWPFYDEDTRPPHTNQDIRDRWLETERKYEQAIEQKATERMKAALVKVREVAMSYPSSDPGYALIIITRHADSALTEPSTPVQGVE